MSFSLNENDRESARTGARDLRAASPRNHLVLIAGDLETLSASLSSHNRDVSQSNLVRRREYRHFSCT